MNQNATDRNAQGDRPLWLVGVWLVLAFLTVAAVVANERWQLLSELAAESRALHSVASQRAGQHDAHLTALSAVAVAGGESRFDLFLEVAGTIHRFYPRIGAIDLVPLNAGATGIDFRQAVRKHWLPELAAFAPEIIFISAGFDAHIEDPMAGLKLVEADYTWITKELCTLADNYSEGRIVSVLEGGYAMSALGRSAVAHIRALMRI